MTARGMTARRLTQAEKDEIARLWTTVQSARQIAQIMGCADATAMRYRPGTQGWKPRSVPKRRKKTESIRQAWKACKTAAEVAAMTGWSLPTVKRHKPPEQRVPASKRISREGYSTWSEAARERWDAYWGDPQERRKTLLGWNE